MKKALSIVIILFGFLISLCGCKNEKVRIYIINQDYAICELRQGQGKQILILNEEQQRFEWTYEIEKDSLGDIVFCFTFNDLPINSNEFTYKTSNGNAINFYYCSEGYPSGHVLTEDTTIYISYSNANDDIKNLIEEHSDIIDIYIYNSTWGFYNQ